MCVSKPETYNLISALNGGQKISTLCNPSSLRWNPNQLEALISSSFPGWSEGGKNELLKMSVSAMSPGPIIKLMVAIRSRGINDFSDLEKDDLYRLEKNVKLTADMWAEFDTVLFL